MIFRTLASATIVSGALLLGSPAQAQYVQAGALTCNLSGSIGMVVASRRALACSFRNSRGNIELYDGIITRIGLDIGATSGGPMVWETGRAQGGERVWSSGVGG